MQLRVYRVFFLIYDWCKYNDWIYEYVRLKGCELGLFSSPQPPSPAQSPVIPTNTQMTAVAERASRDGKYWMLCLAFKPNCWVNIKKKVALFTGIQ